MPDLGPFLRPDAKKYAEDCVRLSREALVHTRAVLDVLYGQDFFQKLDILLPTDTELKELPVLIFIHGGAWKNGFKEWFGYMAPALVSLPAILVSPNYRLAPQVKFPVPLDDCCAMLSWVYSHIAAYGGDSHRIFIGGHSAGGHLASLMALRPELLTKRGLPKDVIKGCFALSAAFDMQRKKADAQRAQLLDLLLQSDDDGASSSPIEFVNGNKVPFHIVHGTHDFPELLTDNKRMVEALRKEGSPVEHYVLDGHSHFDTSIACGDINGVWVQTVRRWLAARGMRQLPA
ncbi:MAG TPA: alpha/beta hydrolase [Magnetospirillaceae bacterium]